VGVPLYAVVRDNVETLYGAVAAGFEGNLRFDARTQGNSPVR
jgi:hypothetical protein